MQILNTVLEGDQPKVIDGFHKKENTISLLFLLQDWQPQSRICLDMRRPEKMTSEARDLSIGARVQVALEEVMRIGFTKR
jgi:hypothetical protein